MMPCKLPEQEGGQKQTETCDQILFWVGVEVHLTPGLKSPYTGVSVTVYKVKVIYCNLAPLVTDGFLAHDVLQLQAQITKDPHNAILKT